MVLETSIFCWEWGGNRCCWFSRKYEMLLFMRSFIFFTNETFPILLTFPFILGCQTHHFYPIFQILLFPSPTLNTLKKRFLLTSPDSSLARQLLTTAVNTHFSDNTFLRQLFFLIISLSEIQFVGKVGLIHLLFLLFLVGVKNIWNFG